ncbi:hypothetical protein M885DRAFT_458925 [Pelagophyceae sp. CCMP2097]|nr:hypothetical protein M885DRAFT_458925 [Pelagophyceae sp. CCMP2097]
MAAKASALALGLGAAAAAAIGLRRWLAYYESDEAYLRLAERVRLRLAPPSQSRFRVVAVVPYGMRLLGQYVIGTNDEAGHVQASICAERAAFVQLALRLRRNNAPPRTIRAVFIVTDSSTPILPGLMCREFMCASRFTQPEETYVVSASAKIAIVAPRATLAQLLPHASPYTRLDGLEQTHLGESLAKVLERPAAGTAAARVYAAAHAAAQHDTRDDLHPLRYGAACYVGEKIHVSHQRKALEYGCTLDAVSLLAQHLDAHKTDKDVFIAMVDQYGVAHAPFAGARAFLSEHGHGASQVLCHDAQGKLAVVAASDLAPDPPAFAHGDLLQTP